MPDLPAYHSQHTHTYTRTHTHAHTHTHTRISAIPTVHSKLRNNQTLNTFYLTQINIHIRVLPWGGRHIAPLLLQRVHSFWRPPHLQSLLPRDRGLPLSESHRLCRRESRAFRRTRNFSLALCVLLDVAPARSSKLLHVRYTCQMRPTSAKKDLHRSRAKKAQNRFSLALRVLLDDVQVCSSKLLQVWHMSKESYGVATVSRIDKIIGLFCRISSLL